MSSFFFFYCSCLNSVLLFPPATNEPVYMRKSWLLTFAAFHNFIPTLHVPTCQEHAAVAAKSSENLTVIYYILRYIVIPNSPLFASPYYCNQRWSSVTTVQLNWMAAAPFQWIGEHLKKKKTHPQLRSVIIDPAEVNTCMTEYLHTQCRSTMSRYRCACAGSTTLLV